MAFTRNITMRIRTRMLFLLCTRSLKTFVAFSFLILVGAVYERGVLEPYSLIYTDKLLDRGQKIEILVDKAEQLSSSANMFERSVWILKWKVTERPLLTCGVASFP